MADRPPTETKNLDIYGNAPLPWSRPRDPCIADVRPMFGKEAE
jgi:hypothetical protein